MAWQKEIDETKHRRHLAEQMGGAEAVARQHAQGKLTVRERIAALADPGSFQEMGSFTGRATYDRDRMVTFMPSRAVIGVSTLNGRKVVIGAGDATIPGGAAYASTGYKMGSAQKLALEWHLPYVRLLDSFGSSVLDIEGVSRTYFLDADTTDETLRLFGAVPVVSAVMGSVEGLPAVEACLAHFTVMVKDTSRIFLAEPGTVKTVLGSDVSEEELGGERTQAHKSGIINNVAKNEEDAFGMIRRFLSYLPDNVWEMPPRLETTDDRNRCDEELLSVVPENRRKPYDPYPILNHVLDRDSIFEIAPLYGRAVITALARVNGYPVGVMIKNPNSPSTGAVDMNSGEKVIRFLQLCDVFHLPLVYFVDEPGFMVGLEAQKEGIPRAAARIVMAGEQTKMPWITFIVRQLYGVAGQIAFRTSGMFRHYAWLTANWGGMHVEGGTAAAYRSDIESAADPEAKLKELENELRILSSPFRTLEAFECHDMIDPRDTRPVLCDFIEAAQGVLKTQLGPTEGAIYRP